MRKVLVIGGCGIIVSRQNVDKSWRRSDCTLKVAVNEAYTRCLKPQ